VFVSCRCWFLFSSLPCWRYLPRWVEQPSMWTNLRKDRRWIWWSCLSTLELNCKHYDRCIAPFHDQRRQCLTAPTHAIHQSLTRDNWLPNLVHGNCKIWMYTSSIINKCAQSIILESRSPVIRSDGQALCGSRTSAVSVHRWMDWMADNVVRFWSERKYDSCRSFYSVHCSAAHQRDAAKNNVWIIRYTFICDVYNPRSNKIAGTVINRWRTPRRAKFLEGLWNSASVRPRYERTAQAML
jgi:hypothetical protein